MEWVPFPHKEYLRRTSRAALSRMRSMLISSELLSKELCESLNGFPSEQNIIGSAIDDSRAMQLRLNILIKHEAFRDLTDQSADPIEVLRIDRIPIVDAAILLMANKAQEIAFWRYLLLVCDLADLSDIRPLYETSLGEAERLDEWLRRAFETLVVDQLHLSGVLSAAPP